MHVLLQYQSKSYYIIGQEVYYSSGRFYYIIGQLLQYRAFLLHYRAVITVSGVYYIIGWYSSQLRASSYKVKLSECYLVRDQVSTRIPTYRREVIDSDDTDDIGPLTIAAPPVSPQEITTKPLVAPPNRSTTTIPIALQEITARPEVPLMIAAPTEMEITAPAETSAHDSARPIRRRQKPA